MDPHCTEVLTSLRRIMRAVDLHSKELIRKYGITSPQLILLQLLDRDGTTRTSDLAKRAQLSNATVTEIVKRLEKQGFLERIQNVRDKREVLIRITERGRQLVEKAPPPLQERFIDEFQKLRDWEQTSVISALQRVASMMESKEVEASPILVSGAIVEQPTE